MVLLISVNYVYICNNGDDGKADIIGYVVDYEDEDSYS